MLAGARRIPDRGFRFPRMHAGAGAPSIGMMLDVSPIDLGLGIVAAALAAPLVVAAVWEDAPAERFARGLIALALLWTIAFAAGAVSCVAGEPAAAGLLAAAAEITLAASIWTVRSRRGFGDDDGGGGGGGGSASGDSPSGAGVPAVYWERWEAQFDQTAVCG